MLCNFFVKVVTNNTAKKITKAAIDAEYLSFQHRAGSNLLILCLISELDYSFSLQTITKTKQHA